jgi:hypothetical protein
MGKRTILVTPSLIKELAKNGEKTYAVRQGIPDSCEITDTDISNDGRFVIELESSEWESDEGIVNPSFSIREEPHVKKNLVIAKSLAFFREFEQVFAKTYPNWQESNARKILREHMAKLEIEIADFGTENISGLLEEPGQIFQPISGE